MIIKPNDIHIWRYTLDQGEHDLEKTSPLLSEEEKKRCSEYMHEAEKVRYTCNHRFVRQVLAKYLGITPSKIIFGKAAMGKPYVKNSDLFFSYSYRAGYGLLAISKNTEVGIDIEKMKILYDPPTFASFSFSEEEKKIIFNCSPEKFQDTLFTFWTFKEAVIKVLGVGLNADLTKIDLSGFFYKDTNPLSFDNEQIYTVKQIWADSGYKAAFAINGHVNCCKEYDFFKNQPINP